MELPQDVDLNANRSPSLVVAADELSSEDDRRRRSDGHSEGAGVLESASVASSNALAISPGDAGAADAGAGDAGAGEKKASKKKKKASPKKKKTTKANAKKAASKQVQKVDELATVGSEKEHLVGGDGGIGARALTKKSGEHDKKGDQEDGEGEKRYDEKDEKDYGDEGDRDRDGDGDAEDPQSTGKQVGKSRGVQASGPRSVSVAAVTTGRGDGLPAQKAVQPAATVIATATTSMAATPGCGWRTTRGGATKAATNTPASTSARGATAAASVSASVAVASGGEASTSEASTRVVAAAAAEKEVKEKYEEATEQSSAKKRVGHEEERDDEEDEPLKTGSSGSKKKVAKAVDKLSNNDNNAKGFVTPGRPVRPQRSVAKAATSAATGEASSAATPSVAAAAEAEGTTGVVEALHAAAEAMTQAAVALTAVVPVARGGDTPAPAPPTTTASRRSRSRSRARNVGNTDDHDAACGDDDARTSVRHRHHGDEGSRARGGRRRDANATSMAKSPSRSRLAPPKSAGAALSSSAVPSTPAPAPASAVSSTPKPAVPSTPAPAPASAVSSTPAPAPASAVASTPKPTPASAAKTLRREIKEPKETKHEKNNDDGGSKAFPTITEYNKSQPVFTTERELKTSDASETFDTDRVHGVHKNMAPNDTTARNDLLKYIFAMLHLLCQIYDKLVTEKECPGNLRPRCNCRQKLRTEIINERKLQGETIKDGQIIVSMRLVSRAFAKLVGNGKPNTTSHYYTLCSESSKLEYLGILYDKPLLGSSSVTDIRVLRNGFVTMLFCAMRYCAAAGKPVGAMVRAVYEGGYCVLWEQLWRSFPHKDGEYHITCNQRVVPLHIPTFDEMKNALPMQS